MADFNFITIPELRRGLETDHKEITDCLECGAWKAVHVLAGGVIEAVLLDALSTQPGADVPALEKMTLGPLVTKAKTIGILSEECESLSTVVRNYRNLIHPGVVKRLEKTAERSGARVAVELVEMIVREVAKHKERTYGFTATQLLKRLRGGASALPLVSHLAKDSNPRELEDLLIKLLPDAILASESAEDGEAAHLLRCYQRLYESASNDVKKAIVKDTYRVYKDEDEPMVIFYEERFLIGEALGYLDEKERTLIKAHLLPRLGVFERVSRALNGIARYLNPKELEWMFGRLAYTIVEDAPPKALHVRSWVEASLRQLNDTSREQVIKSLDESLSAVESYGEEDKKPLIEVIAYARRLHALYTGGISDEDVPF